ncbi:MAG: hypothetical protein ABIT37_01085 [Luteolibacter sp.]
MQNIQQALKNFAARYQGIGLFSTGFNVVNYARVLYNVEGSTDDPAISGGGWKKLLTDNGIDGNCYVTSPSPDRDGTSHPGFDVGGHMTPNADGHVANGGICYLMPLCKWHNSTRRDGTPFEHEETEMLKLSGFMESDLALTFAARLPGDAAYRLVSVEGDALAVRPINAPQLHLFDARVAGPALPPNYLLFRQVEEGGAVRFVIEDSRFQDL